MKYRLLSLFFGIGLALIAPATSFSATGFVNTPLWLNPSSPSEGDNVTLSALFRNEESKSLSGSVVFYDGDVLLGKRGVTIPVGTAVTALVNFRIGAGDHNFSAQMSSLTETLSGGVAVPVALPVVSASLPNYFVAKTLGVPLSAQAQNIVNTANPEKVLLKQVDSAQQSVLDVVPENVKSTLSTNSKNVDNWRSGASTVFVSGRDEAGKELSKIKNTIDAETFKKGSASASVKYVDRPLAYLKWTFFAVLAFLFSNRIAFYLAGIIIAFIILRILFGMLGKIFGGIASSVRKSKKPKPPQV